MSNYKNNREKNWKQTTWLKIIKKNSFGPQVVPANKKLYLIVGASNEFQKIPKNSVMLWLPKYVKEIFSSSS